MTSTTPLSGTLVTTYTYDAANRLTDRAVSDGRTYTYTWSARGQLLAEYTHSYPVRTFTYNATGHLVETTVFTLTTRFTYNGLGDRVAVRVVEQGVTTYTLDLAAGGRILAEETFTGTVLYLYGHECVGELRDSQWLYYLPDAEGLVRQGVDAEGKVVSAWLFAPDGAVLEGPEGPVSHLVCGGVYDWSTGLIYKGGRYFDPTLGTWLALTPLVVVQLWRGRKQKRRGVLWHMVVALLVMGMGSALTACGGGGTPMPPTLTVCTEITTPFGPPLGDNAVFVDPPAGGQHVYRPQAQTWTSADRQMLESALTDVIDSNFGGPASFGSLNAALAQFGVSSTSPIRVFREAVSSTGPDARAGVANPDLIVWQSWFDLGGDPTLQRALLTHEMAHYWDQEHGNALATEMGNWINWGDTATHYASTNPTSEDLPEAVRLYFYPQYDEGREWTDDMGRGLDMANDPRYGGRGRDGLKLDPGQLELPVNQRLPSADGTIQVQDRYDWLQMKFGKPWQVCLPIAMNQ